MDAVLIECLGIILTITLIAGFVWVWETVAGWRRYRRMMKRSRNRERDRIEQAKRRAKGSKW